MREVEEHRQIVMVIRELRESERPRESLSLREAERERLGFFSKKNLGPKGIFI